MQSRSSAAFGLFCAVGVTTCLVVACATSNDTYGDADSGITSGDPGDGSPDGTITTADAAHPPKKDSGTLETDDSGTPVDPDAATCVKDAPSNACGVAPQCGCALTETCDVFDTKGDVVCISAGTSGMGKACTTTAGCLRGLTCLGGACRPYCPAGTASGASCGITGTNQCLYVPDSGNSPIPNDHVCWVTCDLTNPTSCDVPGPAGTVGCYTDNKGNTDCGTLGAGKDGAACTDASNCAPSFTCVNVTVAGKTSSICQQWCKVVGGTCPAAKTCTGFQTPVMVGGAEYGTCS